MKRNTSIMSTRSSKLSTKKGKSNAQGDQTPVGLMADMSNPVDTDNNTDAGNVDDPLKSSLRSVLGQESFLHPLVSTMVKILLETPTLLDQLADAISQSIKEETIAKIKEEVVPELKQEVYTSVSVDVSTTQEDIGKLQAEVKQLKSTNTRLANQLDDNQQYSRRNCLILHGLPEARGENTNEVSLEHINKYLNLNLKSDQIDRSHRLGKRHTNLSSAGKPKHRPIIMKFISYQHRAAVFREKRHLKDTRTLITESLTSARMELLRDAQNQVRLGSIKNVWTLDGRVIVLTNDDKKVTISKKSDLDFF